MAAGGLTGAIFKSSGKSACVPTRKLLMRTTRSWNSTRNSCRNSDDWSRRYMEFHEAEADMRFLSRKSVSHLILEYRQRRPCTPLLAVYPAQSNIIVC